MKISKILGALLAAVMFSTASMAGELTVTGTARASLTTAGSDSTTGAVNSGGKTLGIENEFVFGASGETDGGIAWKYSVQLDKGEIDDSAITLTNSMGTIGLFGEAGGLNFKHGGSQNAIGYASTIGNDAILDPGDISGVNNIQYHTPAGLLPFGAVLKVAYGLSGTDITKPGDSEVAAYSGVRNARNASLELAPIDGVKIGASYYTDDAATDTTDNGQTNESGAAYISYNYGNFGIGYVKGYIAPATVQTGTTVVNEYINTSYSIGFKANDSTTISYGVEKSNANYILDSTADKETKVDSIQVAYTAGGLTLAGALKNIDNADYSANQDQQEAHLILTLAF
jgi:hypothetical protein